MPEELWSPIDVAAFRIDNMRDDISLLLGNKEIALTALRRCRNS